MNRSELIQTLGKDTGLTLKMAEAVVNTVFDDMANALVKGERLEVRGFGSFKLKNYEGYKGRNPKTGDIIKVKPKRLPFFKCGKDLKERVDFS